jgi:septum formation protein
VEFEVVVPDVEEEESGPPREVAVGNAVRKARAGARDGAVVLGVDTVVSLDDRIYGKPVDAQDARATLSALAGRRHGVISGVCVLDAGGERTATARTTVQFREADERLLSWYVQSGEWRERAGGYAIQGRGAALVEAIDGDYTNVVGLPVPTLLELLPDLLG